VFKYKIVLTSFIVFAPVMLPYVLTYYKISANADSYLESEFGRTALYSGNIHINPCPTHFSGRYTSFKPLLLMVFPSNWRSIEARSWLWSMWPASEERQRYITYGEAQFVICAPTNRRKIQMEMEKRVCEKTPDIVIDVRSVNFLRVS
jgi:hypothetical protein